MCFWGCKWTAKYRLKRLWWMADSVFTRQNRSADLGWWFGAEIGSKWIFRFYYNQIHRICSRESEIKLAKKFSLITILLLQGKVARSAVLTTKGQIHLMRAKLLSWRISEKFLKSDPTRSILKRAKLLSWRISEHFLSNWSKMWSKKIHFDARQAPELADFLIFSCRLEPKNNSFWSAPSTWVGGFCEKCPNCRNVSRSRRSRSRRSRSRTY